MPPVHGPLYYERTGRSGPVMAFLPPNPMDQSCWIFQMQHFSTWFRCVAIDTPGYGRSPGADDGVTAQEIARAFWDAVDEVDPLGPVVLVGCSGGFMHALEMHALHPERTSAVVLTGAGYLPRPEGSHTRLESYETEGLAFRPRHIALDFSPAFNATPMAAYLASILLERDSLLDLETIKSQYRAQLGSDPQATEHEQRHLPRMSLLTVDAPCLIVAGTADHLYAEAQVLHELMPGSELRTIPGAGHCAMMEQPWAFDDVVIDYLERQGLMERSRPAV